MKLCGDGGSHSGIDHDSSLLRYDTVLIGKCLLNLRRVKQSNKTFNGLLRRGGVAINLLETSIYVYQPKRLHNMEDLNVFVDPLLSGTHTQWCSWLSDAGSIPDGVAGIFH